VAPRFWAAAWFGTAKSKLNSKRKAGQHQTNRR
jgi:hypothetical protein